MTASRAMAERVAPPWLFTLMSLTGLGAAAILWMLIASAGQRSGDARRHAAVRAELLRLDQAQSASYAASGHFASALEATADGTGLGFVPTTGLQIQFERLSDESWRAVVRDPDLTTAPGACGIFRGTPDASPHRAVIRPGEIACW